MTPERFGKLTHVAERGHSQQIPQAADMLELLAEVERLAAEVAELRKDRVRLSSALLANKQGYQNILDFRKLEGDVWGTRNGYGGRYGALTREEIEAVITAIDAAMQATAQGASGAEGK